MSKEPKKSALAFVAEINEHELAVRLMERAIGLKRAGDPRAAGEIITDVRAGWPNESDASGSFPFSDMATIAILYFQECIKKGQRPA